MLSQEYHEQACRMFCRILRRLEARKQENGQNNKTFNGFTDTTAVRSIMEDRATDGQSLPDLPSREYA